MALYDSSNRNMWQDNDPRVISAEEHYERKHNVILSDINVYVGDNIRENTKAAYRKALSMLESAFFKKVLVINTSTRQHWALKVGREMDPERIGDEAGKPITVVGSVCGDLCKHLEMIKEKIRRNGIRAIIINSWEFSSSCSRYKDKLLFELREMIEERGITILIYAHDRKVSSRDVGTPMHSGIGKLAAIAGLICSVSIDESGMWKQQPEQAQPIAVPIVVEEEFENEAEDISKHFVSEYGLLDPKAMRPLSLIPEPEFVDAEEEAVLEEELVSV